MIEGMDDITQLEGCTQNGKDDTAMATKVFELSQSLNEKWLTADLPAKRQLLEIACLNSSLDGVSLVPEIRKPFDVLAEGQLVQFSRGDWMFTEPRIAIASGDIWAA